jgi:hypothetical protein
MAAVLARPSLRKGNMADETCPQIFRASNS